MDVVKKKKPLGKSLYKNKWSQDMRKKNPRYWKYLERRLLKREAAAALKR